MKRKWIWIAVSALALAGAVLAGCLQQAGLQPEFPIVLPTQTAQPDGPATAAPVQQATPAGNVETRQASKETVEKAKADLAKNLDIPASEITVVVVIGQEFTPDGFYCRTIKGRTSQDEPTVVISGEAILLEAQGIRYEYHANGEAVTFCRQLH